MSDRSIDDATRRRFLAGTGATALAVGIAGCIGDDDDDDAGDEISELEDQISDLEAEVSDLEDEKATLEDENASLEDEVADLEDEIASLEAEISDLEDQLEEAQAEPEYEVADIVDPVASDYVAAWWPMAEGPDSRILEDHVEANDGGLSGNVQWVNDSDYQGGWALEAMGGDHDHVATSTLGDYGSNTSEDFSVALTMNVENQGVVAGVRSAIPVDEDAQEARDDSLAGLVLQCDGAADGRMGVFLRADSPSSSWDYLWTQELVAGQGRFRWVLSKETNNHENYRIYLNGEELTAWHGSSGGFEPERAIDFDVPFTLFGYNGQGVVTRHVRGVLDDVIMYQDYALSEEEAQEDFDRQHWA